VFKDRVLGIEKTLRMFYINIDIDPIFGGAVIQLVDAIE